MTDAQHQPVSSDEHTPTESRPLASLITVIHGKSRFTRVIIICAVLLIPVAFLIWQSIIALNGIGIWDANPAQKSVKPLLTKIERLGGTKIYEVNNINLALYTVQYATYDTSSLTKTIMTSASKLGYALTDNTANLNATYLKDRSDYLAGRSTKGTLTLSIERANTGGYRCLGNGQHGSCNLITITSTGL